MIRRFPISPCFVHNGYVARHQRTRVKHIEAVLNPNEVRALLSQFCVQLGFCLPPTELDRMASSPPGNIDEFTQVVFTAEGLDPVTSDRHLFNQVREIVAPGFRPS